MAKWLWSLLIIVSGYACASEPMAVSFVESLVKVFPDAAVQNAGGTPRVVSARNGHSSVQLALRAGDKRTVRVRMTAPKFQGDALESRLYRVGNVRVELHPKNTPLEEVVRPEVGEYPDPLFPLNGELQLEAGRTQAIWISLFAPASVKPGIYRGAVEVQDGKRTNKLPFEVEVFPATVPKEQKLWVTNWFWFEHERMDKHYPKLKSDPERYWTILENIGRTMADHRQNAMFIPVRTLVKAQLLDGRIRYDFSEFDRWVEIFDRAGVSKLIEGGHLCGRDGGYDGKYVLPTDYIEDGKIARKDLGVDDPRVEPNLREFLRQLRTHLSEKKWISRYVQHVHDEPHGPEMPVYRRFVKIVNEELPGVATVDAISMDENETYPDETKIWVPLLGTFDNKVNVIEAHKSRGGQSWFYTCLHPTGKHLNRFVDFPLLKTRLLHWVNFKYGLTGFLHWGGNFWMDKPYEDLQPNWGGDLRLPAGDDAITYPDPEGDGVFPSIRLEAMREGIEDYELLMVAAQRDPERTKALVGKVMPGFTEYVREVPKFRQYQRELLEIAGGK
jgi:hypothetical protein